MSTPGEPPLTFGTAGLRGPMRPGPGGMNVETVTAATWGLAKVLADRHLGGSTVVVGRDARHHSDAFALATAEVLAAHGFSVVLLPDPVPTPVVAFAVRRSGAAAGVQITASHNPPSDNGYKVYLDGGMQIVPPSDRDIEAAMAAAPHDVPRSDVMPSDTGLIADYVRRASEVRRGTSPVRVALTPMHGVGGEPALRVLREAGITDVHVVAEQFAPDGDFPTVAFPNPEEAGATDLLLALAADVDADVAIALDPDADRCAVGIPTDSGWRMLSGDETGWLLGDYVLTQLDPGVVTAHAVVASTVVSSRMLASIAAAHGAQHVETLTGFKWLARGDADLPGSTLVYAYEEAIGHCVDPSAVRDKDGISAAVLACDLVAELRAAGRTPSDALDALALRHGVHVTAAVSVPADAHLMQRLRTAPPSRLAGELVEVSDLLGRTDALIYTGESVRVAVRPSGTEPKVKVYFEIRLPPRDDVAAARGEAAERLDALRADVVGLLQRGPN
ncbi:phosphomannomutase [Mycolicibacterium madagascariense]|uniref:Phosphomannomutase n=2 Tax=Mycolicibacterium madagascariense TaxID=212765 RepID=A0A7I7XEB0_9MYCO|nr:phospho-sugar mutase [Mycolicibacterium madagascariense]MCV7015654.1 phospho-sugar mutase [Mycolicibacterium madagascariense]BBZ27068.1 phosphomannomutase [Mycolicibacterium madagascariense]